MTNTEKTAAFLIAIGKDAAVEILRNFDEDTVVKLTTEMAKIESLNSDEKEEIIGDFMVAFNKIKNSSFGGEEFVKKVLIGSVGIEKAKEISRKAAGVSPKESFAFLKSVEPEMIVSLIDGEHPQTVAVLFSHLSSEKCGKVIAQLDRNMAKDVALRLARMQKVSPEAVVSVAAALRKKYEKLASNQTLRDTPGGVDKLADIFNHLDPQTESALMKHFESTVPDTASKISDKIYTFECALDLTNIEIRILIDAVSDDELLVYALKGAGDELRIKFLRNVSNNRATDIINEMDNVGPVRMSEIEDARREILMIMRALDQEGKIVIKKHKEKYVE
jgi:flagellar motor switch protein FliG